MARGTQHRKRRPTADARRVETVAAKRAKPRHASWEDQLFFSRLRVHAKWVFVFLALVFGLGFVLFGVGSGSTGIGDILQNAFRGNGSSGSKSVGDLRSAVRKHPRDAQAWRDLATRLEQDQKTVDAINALKRYTALRPHDTGALEELAGLYSRKVDDYKNQAAIAQSQAQTLAPSSTFQPPSSTATGRLYSDPNALQDPIANAIQTQASGRVNQAYANLSAASRDAVVIYKKLTKLNPNDATRQVQLGEAAQNAGDAQTAVAAYRRFLKLAPNDPLVPAVKQQLKTLTGGSIAPAVSSG